LTGPSDHEESGSSLSLRASDEKAIPSTASVPRRRRALVMGLSKKLVGFVQD
jgi:hypothetical protein